MTLILIIVGAVSYTYLPLREYPRVDKPVVSVTTAYEGASPQIIETRVTKIVESALAGIEGIDFMKSVSEGESSRVNVYFKPERNIDAAASDIRDRISKIKVKLPDGAKDSIIKKSDADAIPIIYVALYSEDNAYSTAELYDYAHHYLESDFEAIGGVAAVDLFGSQGHVMHIWLDPIKMAAYRVTTQDVSTALKQQNIHKPAGQLKGTDREYMVTTSATLKSAEEFNNVVVAKEKDYLIRIKDIGRAEFSPGIEKNAAFYNGKPAIAIGLIKKSISNPLEVSEYVKKILPEMKRNLPKAMKLEFAVDKSIPIKQSIEEVYKTFFEAVICVLFIILLFLWSFRAAIIPLVTIPVSIIATFTLLYAFGFSLNILTLLAIVLAIGLVVDDAIVMMENIHRYIENGMSPMKAAIKGSQEISFAVIAMTLTLAAVYAPISLSTGTIGKLFTEFALTLAGSVIISGFVALTLTPMMCSRLLRGHTKNTAKNRRISNIIQSKSKKIPQEYHDVWQAIKRSAKKLDFNFYYSEFEVWYNKILLKAMTYRKLILIGAFILFSFGSFIGFKVLPSELTPNEDLGIINNSGMLPQGATIEFTKKYMMQVQEIMSKVPEVEGQLAIISPPNPMIMNILKPWDKRKRSSLEIIKEIKPEVRKITGIIATASPGRTLISSGGGSDESLEFVLQTTKSQSELESGSSILQSALNRARAIPYLNTDKEDAIQEYIINIKRSKAALLGIDVSAIAEAFDTFISGRRVTDFKKDTEQFDVVLSVDEKRKRAPNDLSNMYIKGSNNKETMIPLSSVVTIKQERIPARINHYNQLRSVTLSGEPAKNLSMGEVVEIFQNVAKQVLPDSIRTEFSGETKQYMEAQYTIYLIFGLALIFIYLIMAAQFESFVDPLIIMFSVPMSLSGALITLWITGHSLSIYSQIGLVTLIGLITKHGILIVEFANVIRDENPKISRTNAAIRATMLRLRPILMTTGAMVLGAIPLVLASGAGAVSRSQIGWVIVGGMTIGTMFTLFVVPAIYSLIARKDRTEISKKTS
jgi:multidrug efflux pump